MDVLDIHFAVVAGESEQPSGDSYHLATPIVYGTAFAVAPEIFVTAGHVYRAADADGKVALAKRHRSRQRVRPVVAFEVFEQVDLALLRCPDLDPFVVPVEFGPLELLADVRAAGFPFGPEPGYFVDVIRGFKGHIVTRRRSFRFAGGS